MKKMMRAVMIGAMLAGSIAAHAESDAQFKARFACQLDGASAGLAASKMIDQGVSASTLTDAFTSQAAKTPAKADTYRHQAELVRYVSKAIGEDKARNEKHDATWYAAEVAALCVSFGADAKYLDAKVTR